MSKVIDVLNDTRVREAIFIMNDMNSPAEYRERARKVVESELMVNPGEATHEITIQANIDWADLAKQLAPEFQKLVKEGDDLLFDAATEIKAFDEPQKPVLNFVHGNEELTDYVRALVLEHIKFDEDIIDYSITITPLGIGVGYLKADSDWVNINL